MNVKARTSVWVHAWYVPGRYGDKVVAGFMVKMGKASWALWDKVPSSALAGVSQLEQEWLIALNDRSCVGTRRQDRQRLSRMSKARQVDEPLRTQCDPGLPPGWRRHWSDTTRPAGRRSWIRCQRVANMDPVKQQKSDHRDL